MIQPHLPIRLPCYDFTPITGPTFGRALLAVRLRTSGVPDSRRLRDFEKIELQPGETKTVCFEVAAEELAFAKNDAKWYLEKGSYTVQCGQLVEKLTCLEDASLGEHI